MAKYRNIFFHKKQTGNLPRNYSYRIAICHQHFEGILEPENFSTPAMEVGNQRKKEIFDFNDFCLNFDALCVEKALGESVSILSESARTNFCFSERHGQIYSQLFNEKLSY